MIGKGQAALYKRDLYKSHDIRKATFNISWHETIILFATFFIGRVSIIEYLMPFSVAFLAVVFAFYRRDVIFGIAAAAGILTAHFDVDSFKYILTIVLLYTAFHLYVENERSRLDEHSITWRAAVSALICVFVSHIVFNVFKGITLYNMFLALSDALITFIFILIFKNVQNVLFMPARRRILSSEEIITLGIIIALVVEGFFDIRLWDISLKNVISLFTVMTLGYIWGTGVGSSLGITVGIIMSLSGSIPSYAIADLGFCGMLAGVFNHLGRWGSIAGFIIGNAILTYYMNGSSAVIMPFEDIIIAGIILIALPRKVIEFLKEYTGFYRLEAQKDYISKIKEFLNRRLMGFAKMFDELARTFDTNKQDIDDLRQQNVSNILNITTSKICRYCSSYKQCWEQEPYNTYQNMLTLMKIVEDKGKTKKGSILMDLRRKCPHVSEIKRAMEQTYASSGFDYKCQQVMEESRKLVSDQLAGMSEVIAELASDIDIYMSFDSAVEDAIMVALDQKGIRVSNAVVTQNSDGKLEIELVCRQCDDNLSCAHRVSGIVSATLNKDFMVRSSAYTGSDRTECVIRLVEAERFNIVTGVAHRVRHGAVVCGDNYTFMPFKNGKYIMAVSDGMGTGQKAAAESLTAITLLEQMLEVGFDKNLIIKTINSVLMLRDPGEMFATMDICLLDMIEGVAEFIKIGACPSFIKSNDKVEIVCSTSLPIGIVADVEFDSIKRKFRSGDFIIMITDGVLDANKKIEDKERWLADLIENIMTPNPQEMAERILYNVLEEAELDFPEDDMTVLVSRLWESK